MSIQCLAWFSSATYSSQTVLLLLFVNLRNAWQAMQTPIYAVADFLINDNQVIARDQW